MSCKVLLASCRRAPFWLLTGLSVVIAVSLSGCSGCQSDKKSEKEKTADKKQDEKKKEKEKPKPDFKIGRFDSIPGDETDAALKPGHYVVTTRKIVANNFDFTGELRTEVLDRHSDPVALERSPYRLAAVRPVSLPKGQEKDFRTLNFTPRAAGGESFAMVDTRLRGRGGDALREPQPASPMPAHEYVLLVLSRRPGDYGGLKRSGTVQPLISGLGGAHRHYRVRAPKIEQAAPAPDSPLAWTAIACLIWDNCDPANFTPPQQAALIDWLHWGGVLVVSGPGSLDTLKGTFLEGYLPADSAGPQRLTAEDFEPWRQALAGGLKSGGSDIKTPPLPAISIEAARPMLGAALSVRQEGRFVEPAGRLLAERQVGRGRVLVTSFPLGDNRVQEWAAFDALLNGPILRRPARTLKRTDRGDLLLLWQDTNHHVHDPRLVSNLRYFSRDAGYPAEQLKLDPRFVNEDRDPYYYDDEDWPTRQPPPWRDYDDAPRLSEAARQVAGAPQDMLGPNGYRMMATGPSWSATSRLLPHAGHRPAHESGVAGWSDFNAVSMAARQTLKEAAGTPVPKAGFVLLVLCGYLIVLAPLNWLVFKLLGRVEWAWVAAPIIAIVGTAAVIRLAQLDIGFRRGRTEVAVLEIQGGHTRAHLTRYTALYNSLTSTYSVSFEDAAAVAQPFSSNPTNEELRLKRVSTVVLRRDSETSLRGFRVLSNSTGMLHSEQMFDLGGGLRYNPRGGASIALLRNDTSYNLRGAGLVRRTKEGRIEAAWLGELASGDKADARFKPLDPSDKAAARYLLPAWQELAVTRRPSQAAQGRLTDGIDLHRLLDLARDPRRIQPGEVKLIAWIDGELPGMEIRPAPSALEFKTLVVAHLAYGPPPPVETDAAIAGVSKLDDDDPNDFENP